MSVTELTPKRVFVFEGEHLEDPNPSMHPHEIVELLAMQKPQMLNAKMSEPTLSEDGETIFYELKSSVAQHG